MTRSLRQVTDAEIYAYAEPLKDGSLKIIDLAKTLDVKYESLQARLRRMFPNTKLGGHGRKGNQSQTTRLKLEAAIVEAKRGDLSISDVARRHGLPTNTLLNRMARERRKEDGLKAIEAAKLREILREKEEAEARQQKYEELQVLAAKRRQATTGSPYAVADSDVKLVRSLLMDPEKAPKLAVFARKLAKLT